MICYKVHGDFPPFAGRRRGCKLNESRRALAIGTDSA